MTDCRYIPGEDALKRCPERTGDCAGEPLLLRQVAAVTACAEITVGKDAGCRTNRPQSGASIGRGTQRSDRRAEDRFYGTAADEIRPASVFKHAGPTLATREDGNRPALGRSDE
jgi:hypothetical protein